MAAGGGRLRVGFVQFEPVFGERAANLERALALAGAVEADLLVLPELATTGYAFADRAEAVALAETVPGGPSQRRAAEFCRDRGLHLVLGLAERAGGALYNSAVLVGPAGHLGTYRKVHLFDREGLVFDPGDLGFPVFEALGTRLGLMVCFDWVFPEAARTLARRGARILCHPANLVLPHCPHAMPVRCLENGVFAVTANRVGRENRAGQALTFIGRSQVIGPDSSVLAAAPQEGESVMVVEVDPERAAEKRIGPSNDLFADRRPESYDLA